MKVIESPELSTQYEKRYIVIDEETNKVLDDAQGYSYKTIRNALEPDFTAGELLKVWIKQN